MALSGPGRSSCLPRFFALLALSTQVGMTYEHHYKQRTKMLQKVYAVHHAYALPAGSGERSGQHSCRQQLVQMAMLITVKRWLACTQGCTLKCMQASARHLGNPISMAPVQLPPNGGAAERPCRVRMGTQDAGCRRSSRAVMRTVSGITSVLLGGTQQLLVLVRHVRASAHIPDTSLTCALARARARPRVRPFQRLPNTPGAAAGQPGSLLGGGRLCGRGGERLGSWELGVGSWQLTAALWSRPARANARLPGPPVTLAGYQTTLEGCRENASSAQTTFDCNPLPQDTPCAHVRVRCTVPYCTAPCCTAGIPRQRGGSQAAAAVPL